MIEVLERWLGHSVVRNPGLVALFLISLTAIAAVLVPQLEFEPDVSRLLPEKNETFQLGRGLQEIRGTSRTLLIELRGDNITERIPAIVESLKSSPHIESVTATRDEFVGKDASVFREAPIYYAPVEVLDRLEERMIGAGREEALEESMELLAEDPGAAGTVVRKDPLGLRWVWSEGVTSSLPLGLEAGTDLLVLRGGKRALLRIIGKSVPYDLKFTSTLLADLDERLADVEAVYYGDYARAQADSQRVKDDLFGSALMSLGLVVLFLTLSMRKFIEPWLLFTPIVLAIFWTLPIGGAILGPMTALTVSAAAILAGLGVDFTIHYLVRYRTERQLLEHEDAVAETFAAVGMPLLAGMLTTVAAFLSLTTAEFRGLRIFGSLLAIGLAFAFLSSILLLPLLVGVRKRPQKVHTKSWVTRFLDSLAASPVGVYVGMMLLGISVAGVLVAAVHGVRFTADLDSFRPLNTENAVAENRFEEELGFSTMPVALLFEQTVDHDQTAEAIERLIESGQVAFASGPFLSHPTPKRRARVEEFRRRIHGWVDATLADLEELGFEPEPFKEGLASYQEMFSRDPEPTPVRPELAVNGKGYEVVFCYPRTRLTKQEAWWSFRDHLNEAFGYEVVAFHTQSVLVEIRQLMLKDLIRAAILTGLVCVLLVVRFAGGIVEGILALLPCMSSFGIVLGTLSLLDIPLNMGNCVAIPFLLGIGVDHGVHLVAHFRDGKQVGSGACGVAIWRSSATTMLGFGSLMAAQTPGIASMGMISILGVASCLTTGLLVFPVLWRLRNRTSKKGNDRDPLVVPRSPIITNRRR